MDKENIKEKSSIIKVAANHNWYHGHTLNSATELLGDVKKDRSEKKGREMHRCMGKQWFFRDNPGVTGNSW